MKRELKTKFDRKLVGVLVVGLTILYLMVTTAFAQEGSFGPTTNTNMNLKRDPLSWGDVWAFGSDEYNNSESLYKDQNAKKNYLYYDTSQDTTSSTAPAKKTCSGYTYYGTVTTANKQGITGGTELTTYTGDKFYSGVTVGAVDAPIGLEGAKIPVASVASGTGVYSVIPNSTGKYRIYVYSPNGNPSNLAHYALLETWQTNNSRDTQMGTARTFTQVGSTDWYYTEVTVSNLSWSAYAPAVNNTHSTSSNTTSAGDTGTGTKTGTAYTSLSSKTYYHFYNAWTYTERFYNTVLTIQFDASVKLGPITRTADTLTVNSGSDGTITAYDPFGQSFTTGAANYHMPVYFTATPSGASSFSGFTDGSGNAVAVTTYTANETNYYEYIFEAPATLNANWEIMIDFPTVNISGGATATAHYYLNKAGTSSYRYGTPTSYTFTADYTDAVNSPIGYTAVANGSTVASGTLSSAGDSFSVTAQWYEVVVTFTSTYDGVTRSMTYTMSPSTSGMTAVAKIGSTDYYFLEDALAAATNGNTVILVSGYTFLTENCKPEWGSMDGGAGYTVKSGVTFIVRHNNTATTVITSTATTEHTYACKTETTATTGTGGSKPGDANTYQTLTVPAGVNLQIASGGLMAVGGTTNGAGMIVGPHADVHLLSGATITVKGRLSSCGFIYGAGLITTVSGAEIYVPFTVHDFRGGGYVVGSAGKLSTNYGISPISGEGKAISPFIRYSFLSIQCRQHIVSGATVTAYADLYANDAHNRSKATIIGNDASSCLLALANGSSVDIHYDGSIYASTYPAIGKMYLVINGDATYGGLTLEIETGIANATVNTREVNFTLPYNFTVEIASGTFSIPNKMMLLPGASVLVDEGATVNIAANLTIYDGLNDWTTGASTTLDIVHTGYNTGDYAGKATSGNNASYPSSAVLMASPFYGSGAADFTVNGTLNLNSGSLGGIIQTTSGGNARINVAAGFGASTTTQIGTTGEYTINLLIVKKEYAFCGATVRTLNGQILDTATGRRTNISAPSSGTRTYYPSAGSDKIDSYQYDLHYYSKNTSVKDSHTEDVNLMLQGSWYNYAVPVYLVLNGQVSATPTTTYFAHGADVTGLGYYSDSGLTTAVTSITDASALYYNGVVEAMVDWADGSEDTYFTSLRNAAKAAIHENDRVVLLADLTGYDNIIGPSATQNFIVDLNGHTIAYKSSPFASNAGGTMTVDLNGGTITNLVGDTCYYYPVIANVPEGSTLTLKLNGGTINTLGNANTEVKNCMVSNAGNLTIDLGGPNGGGTWNFTTGFTAANAAFRAKSVILNDGNLTVTTSASDKSGTLTTDLLQDNTSVTNFVSVIRNNPDARLAITGGTLTMSQNVNDNAATVLNIGGTTVGTISEISGASLQTTRGYCLYNYGAQVDKISGGAWVGRMGICNRNYRKTVVSSGVTPVLYSVANIDLIEDANITCTYQYALLNYGTIGTIGGNAEFHNTGTGSYIVYNSNQWFWDSYIASRSESGLTRTDTYISDDARIPTIGTITGNVEISSTTCSYGLANLGNINSIHGDNVVIKAKQYAISLTEGGKIDSISGTATIAATAGNYGISISGQRNGTVVYTYPIKLGTNSTHEVYTYGRVSQIGSISGNVTISATGSYGLYNVGYVASITGSGVTVSANREALYNSGSGPYSTRDYTRYYNNPEDATTEYRRENVYTRNLDKGGVIDEIRGISLLGTGSSAALALDNYGYIGTLADTTIGLASGATASGSVSYPLMRNGDSRHANHTELIQTNWTEASGADHVTVGSGICTRYDRDYTYTAATIHNMSNVTVTKSAAYALVNAGKIVTMSGCTITGTQYSLYNYAAGPYTARKAVQYYSGASIFSTTKYTSELTYWYQRDPSEITTITDCTITTPANTYALHNSGHIGTIQNSTIRAGTTTAKSLALYNGGSRERSYEYNLETLLYVYANGATACTAYYGTNGESKVVSYDYDAPVIDLIGAGNTITATTATVQNDGIITAIDSGTGTPTVITGSDAKGSAVYNATATLDTRTTTTPYTAATTSPGNGTAGTATNSDKYLAGASIGTIKNTYIDANGYGIKNGNASASYLPTIGELGAGLEINAHCTTAGYAAIYNTTYAKISSITGGLYKVATATTYAYKNDNNNAAHATLISGGDFKGMANTRTNAIYDPDNTSRQTYPSGYTLSSSTETPSYTNSNMGGDYYYISRFYTITWMNGSTQLGTSKVSENATPAYSGTAPTKAQTAQFTYTFDGWSATDGGEKLATIPVATANATYYAHYSQKTRTYTITWEQDDGTTIDTTTVEYGKTPTHSDPTKASNAEFTFAFAGWSPALTTVSADATYTATFTPTRREYTVTFVANGGSGSMASQSIPYGVATALNANTFTAPSGYGFSGWNEAADGSGTSYADGESITITGNKTLYAQWAAMYSYTITWGDLSSFTYTAPSYEWDAESMSYVQTNTSTAGWSSSNSPSVTVTNHSTTLPVHGELTFVKDASITEWVPGMSYFSDAAMTAVANSSANIPAQSVWTVYMMPTGTPETSWSGTKTIGTVRITVSSVD